MDQSGPATVMAEIVDEGTIVDQSGPEWTSDCDG